jgi:hypothetical protein
MHVNVMAEIIDDMISIVHVARIVLVSNACNIFGRKH